ncbi:MAG: cyclic nucleotide-binding domain-containing protein, partial [Myxococcales bacterium]|nr:cyclic nucleotide-binding domain-containing protein [Myxococcales bacterium]
LGVRALRKLVAAARRVAVAEGDVVFREGDAPDALYVVVEGAVVPIAEATDASPRRRLGVIEAGGYFGEIALVTNEPRNATIEALVDTELLAIDRAVVAELLDEEPEMLAVLLRLLRERLVARLVRTSAVFAGLAAAERRALARRFRLLEVRAGATLIEQGQAASALYLVLAGALRASAREDACGEKEIATLGPGAPCGEMSLLRGVPASATVRAARKSWVLMLPRAEFERAAEEARGLRERLAAIADARRAEGLAAFDPEDSFDDADVVELV